MRHSLYSYSFVGYLLNLSDLILVFWHSVISFGQILEFCQKGFRFSLLLTPLPSFEEDSIGANEMCSKEKNILRTLLSWLQLQLSVLVT